MPTHAPAPATEDAFMAVLLALGPVLRQRQPEDEYDYSLLPVLADLHRTGPSRLAEIADRLLLDASTVSRRIKYLLAEEMVSTTADAEDARARRVHILPAGRRVMRQLLDQRRRLLSQVISEWPAEDRAQLERLLTRFLHDLHDTAHPGAPSARTPS